jgi:small subunit ribosomal protein S19
MARSTKKGVFYPLFFFKKSKNLGFLQNCFCRSVKIPAEFVDRTSTIYNGKGFIKSTISSLMLGQRFGEFAPTRAIYVPKRKKSAKKKSAKKKSAKKK